MPNRPKQPSKTLTIVGIDAHPDIFSACWLSGTTNFDAKIQRRAVDVPIGELESWAIQHLGASDTVVLEAGANSFESPPSSPSWGLAF